MNHYGTTSLAHIINPQQITSLIKFTIQLKWKIQDLNTATQLLCSSFWVTVRSFSSMVHFEGNGFRDKTNALKLRLLAIVIKIKISIVSAASKNRVRNDACRLYCLFNYVERRKFSR